MLISIGRQSDALFAAMEEDVAQSLAMGELVEIIPPSWPDYVPAGVWFPADQVQSPAA